jgi:hypothetical protein
MEVIGWLLAAPVAALAAVVLVALLVVGFYGVVLAGVVGLLWVAFGMDGSDGVLVSAGVLVVSCGVLVGVRRRGGDKRLPEPDAHAGVQENVPPPARADTVGAPTSRPAPAPQRPKGRCPVCRRTVPLTPARGVVKTHVTKGERCIGMGMVPEKV